jgi:serralysin
MATVSGTNSADILNRFDGITDNADTIFGLGGNDTIFGLGGNDNIRGGLGADVLLGGAGTDTAIYDDSAAGVFVNLASGRGAHGTAQGDTLSSIENVTGSTLNDTLMGNGVGNVLGGGAGNDVLKGGGGADTLAGNSGNDTLVGGTGADLLNGSSGIDTASYAGSSARVVVSLLADTAAHGEAAGDELNGIENLTGSGHDDVLHGSSGANVLQGLKGNDTLKGFGGADSLLGGDGEDSLDGGTNNDTLDGGKGDDRLDGGNDSLNGGADNDTLNGGSGNDVLNGAAGADAMDGGIGNDTYRIDDAADSITDAGGNDIANASVTYALAAGVAVETLRTNDAAGTSAIHLTGNEFDQAVTGNDGNNIINGKLGNDTLTGNDGDDLFTFNTALNAATNVDNVTDFIVADDTMRLENSIFTGLAAGTLDADAFHIGAAAEDAEDRIIYNSDTGALYFDANGSAGGGLIKFAQLDAGLGLTNNDFIVV